MMLIFPKLIYKIITISIINSRGDFGKLILKLIEV